MSGGVASIQTARQFFVLAFVIALMCSKIFKNSASLTTCARSSVVLGGLLFGNRLNTLGIKFSQLLSDNIGVYPSARCAEPPPQGKSE